MLLERAREIYHQSLKPRDIFWNNYVSRPPAAVVVAWLEPTTITPNQVTFASLGVFALAASVLIAWRAWPGLLVAAVLMQASYILDCADGQLARYKGLASPVGALLDFLMDEFKAFLLVGAAAVRLWLQREQAGDVDADFWLLVGVTGMFVVACGISLTAFMRRPEYPTGRAEPNPDATTRVDTNHPPSPVRRAVALVERAGSFVFHYPTYFLAVALFDVVDLFLFVYLGTHLAYLGRSSLMVMLRLGAPGPKRVVPAGRQGGIKRALEHQEVGEQEAEPE